MNTYKIKFSLKQLGISPSMKGYIYLCRAIELVCDDNRYFCRSADALYTTIAQENGTHVHCIERDIRTAIRDSQCSTSVKKLIFMIAESVLTENLLE